MLKKQIRLSFLSWVVFFAAAVGIFFAAYPIFMRYLYGFQGDPSWVTWYIKWLGDSSLNNVDWTYAPAISYPFGLDFSTSPQYPAIDFISKNCAILFNEIAAHNFIVLMSFPLSFFTMYILIKKITGNPYSAFFCGVVYAFCPYHTAHSLQHLSLSNIQWFPLYVYALLELNDRVNLRSVLLGAVSMALIFFTDYYYVYFALLITLIFVITVFIFGKKDISPKRKILGLMAVFLIAAFFIIPVNYTELKGVFDLGKKGVVDQQYQRSTADLLTFSAKPLDYFIPPKHNPYLGKFIPDFGVSPFKGHRLTEHTLYLGIIPLFFALASLVMALRKIKSLEIKDKFIILFSLFIVVAAGLVSLPPEVPLGQFAFDPVRKEIIAEHKLYMPSFFMYKILPFFRCYARFGLLVMLGITILAGLGLSGILDGIKKKSKKVLLTVILSLAVFLEFYSLPPVMCIDTYNIPGAYTWLKDQPGDFAVVEYPIGDESDPFTTSEYVFFQRVHGKKLVNGTASGSDVDKFTREIRDITKSETLDTLKTAGIEYVIIHNDKYRNGNKYVKLDWVTDDIPRNKIYPIGYMFGNVPDIDNAGLEFVKSFGETKIYKIKK